MQTTYHNTWHISETRIILVNTFVLTKCYRISPNLLLLLCFGVKRLLVTNNLLAFKSLSYKVTASVQAESSSVDARPLIRLSVKSGASMKSWLLQSALCTDLTVPSDNRAIQICLFLPWYYNSRSKTLKWSSLTKTIFSKLLNWSSNWLTDWIYFSSHCSQATRGM